jgi:hypothetical protein
LLEKISSLHLTNSLLPAHEISIPASAEMIPMSSGIVPTCVGIIPAHAGIIPAGAGKPLKDVFSVLEKNVF